MDALGTKHDANYDFFDMTSLQAYIAGFKTLFQFKKLWLWYYLANLVIALLASIPVFYFFKGNFGHSVAMQDLLERFDFRIITDILNQYGVGIAPLFNQSMVLSVFFLILTAYFLGGILRTYLLKDTHVDAASFVANCFRYGRKILFLAVLFLGLQLLLFAVFWFSFESLSGGFSPDDVESEAVITSALRWVGVPYLVVVAIFSMVHDYAKVHLVRKSTGVFASFLNGFRFCWTHFRTVFFLMLFHLLTFLVVYVLYKLIDMGFSETTGLRVFLFFLISQVFIFLRIGLKLWNLGSVVKVLSVKVF